MRYIKLSIHSLGEQLRNEPKSILLIVISVAITIASSLVIMKAMMFANAAIYEAEEQKKEYLFSFNSLMYNGNEKKSYDLIEGLLERSIYSRVVQLEGLQAFATDYIERGRNCYQFNPYLVLSENFEITSEINVPEMISGSWFSNQQLNSKEKVIILSQQDQKSIFKGDNVGDIIDLLGNRFTIIGIAKCDQSYIPYSVIKECNGFILGINSVKFAEKLSNVKRQELKQQVTDACSDSNVDNVYEINKSDYYATYIGYSILILLILVFCACNCSSMFHYCISKKLYEFNIYKICGISNNQIRYMLGIYMGIIYGVSSLLGAILYRCSIPMQNFLGINMELSSKSILAVVIGILAILCLTIIPSIEKLVKRPPIDQTFWGY